MNTQEIHNSLKAINQKLGRYRDRNPNAGSIDDILPVLDELISAPIPEAQRRKFLKLAPFKKALSTNFWEARNYWFSRCPELFSLEFSWERITGFFVEEDIKWLEDRNLFIPYTYSLDNDMVGIAQTLHVNPTLSPELFARLLARIPQFLDPKHVSSRLDRLTRICWLTTDKDPQIRATLKTDWQKYVSWDEKLHADYSVYKENFPFVPKQHIPFFQEMCLESFRGGYLYHNVNNYTYDFLKIIFEDIKSISKYSSLKSVERALHMAIPYMSYQEFSALGLDYSPWSHLIGTKLEGAQVNLPDVEI